MAFLDTVDVALLLPPAGRNATDFHLRAQARISGEEAKKRWRKRRDFQASPATASLVG